jgi:hypothetical protein
MRDHGDVVVAPPFSAARYGAETPVPEWRERLVCSHLRVPAGSIWW